MANGMARNIEKIEATITEKVMGWILSYLLVKIKLDFSHFAASKVNVSQVYDRSVHDAYLKSLSSTGESLLSGNPGINFSLKPGPTHNSADSGNKLGSPV